MFRTVLNVILCLFFVITTTSLSCGDDRTDKIEHFLEHHAPKSPLRGYEKTIIKWADHFNLDWRLYVAIAGIESSYGKVSLHNSHNFTGICNGRKRFESIDANIHETHRLIAEEKWYRKYRRTNKLEDLVYVYKGVPPYEPYINKMRFIFNKLEAIPTPSQKFK